MRESLTILAVAVILLLSALLVGPYLIDWNGQRDWLAARLSQAVGAQVRIAGPIDVKLLPRPIFRATNVSMVGATGQDPHLAAARLDAELSINGLLQGAIEFVDARIASPRLEVTLRPDGSIVAPAWDVQNPQKFQFSHFIVSDGTVAIKDESGADRLLLSGIEAQGEAETLFGPLKMSGGANQAGKRFTFRMNTGSYAARKLRARLVVDATGGLTHADAEGLITVGPVALAAVGQAPLSFEGSVNVAGSLHVADGAAPVPWRVAATSVKADARAVSAAALELRAGVEGRALVANGAALLNLGGAPAAVIQMRARQLDLDRIAVPPEVAPDTPRPRARQWLAAVQDLVDGAGPVPIQLVLKAGIDAVTAGDLTLTDAAATLQLKPGAPPRGAFSIVGPNGSRLALDGVVEPGPASAFNGQIDAATRDLATAAAWLDPFWPGTADWIVRNALARSVAFKGHVDVSEVGISARDTAIEVDGSSLSGAFSMTREVAGERPRLFADLTADTLDAERLPDLNSLAAALSPFDLSLGVAAESVKLSRSDMAPIEAGRLAFHLTKRADDVALDQFSIAGLEGATVTATASLDAARHVQAQGHADAKDAVPLAAVLRHLAPGQAADAFTSRAALLSPLGLEFKVEGTLVDGGLTPTLATGSGTFGSTRFSASITPETAQGSDTPVDALVLLDAADASALFRQLGLPAAAVPIGAGHVELLAKGTSRAGFETHASASLADSKLSFEGTVRSDSGWGRATAAGRNAIPLMQAVGWAGPSGKPVWPWTAEGDVAWSDGTLKIDKLTSRVNGRLVAGTLAHAFGPASPDALSAPVLTGNLAIDTLSLADLTGLALGQTGATSPQGAEGWSTAKFAAMPSWPRTEIGLRLGLLTLSPGLTARDAALTLTLGPGSMMLTNVSGHVLDGTAGGAVTLRRDGASASLTGQVKLDDLALGLPSLAGRLSTTLNLAGTGSSPDALIGSIAGEGTLAITGAKIPRFDPGALTRVAAAFNQEGATIDEPTVRDALTKALDRGPIALGDVQSSVTLAAGTVRVVGLKVKGPDFTAAGEGAFNLRGLTLALRTTLSSAELPKDWKGDPPQVTVTWGGPLLAPSRDVDAAAFVNGLAARAIARDQERIELMQDDIRERAFFARRLKSIEAEQQAARDAVQIQKMVAQPPRPGDIRVPKAPDVAPPAGTPGLRPSDVQGPIAPDDLTRLIDSLRTVPLPPSRPIVRTTKPVELAPSSQATPLAGPSPASTDPATAGRY